MAEDELNNYVMTEILIDHRYWSHICFGPSPTEVMVGEGPCLPAQERCAPLLEPLTSHRTRISH